MGNRRSRVRIVVALVAVVTTIALGAVVGPGLVQAWLYDNRPSGVACQDLPTRAES